MTNPIATEWNENAGSHTKIAYARSDLKELVSTELNPYFQISYNNSLTQLEEYLGNQSILTLPEIILIEVDQHGECFELIERLITDPDIKHLLLIGAYRDNEVSSSHPLIRTLAAVRGGPALAILRVRARMSAGSIASSGCAPSSGLM